MKYHGKSLTPTYHSWAGMMARCYRESHPCYKNYGGRGISVCTRWRVFTNFMEDMGERPPGTTLNRLNNDGIYEPGNCNWANWSEQVNNTRVNRNLTLHGQTLTQAQWSLKTGLKSSTINKRLKLGWSVEDALSYPLRRTQGCSSDSKQGFGLTVTPSAMLRARQFLEWYWPQTRGGTALRDTCLDVPTITELMVAYHKSLKKEQLRQVGK